jgi:hypothetical protein
VPIRIWSKDNLSLSGFQVLSRITEFISTEAPADVVGLLYTP